MEDSQKEQQSEKTGNLGKKILIIAMVLCFFVIALTGILKFRELLRPFNIPFDKLPIQQISILHDWAGIALVFLIVLHLIYQKTWFKRFFQKSINFKIFNTIAILILAIAGIFLIKFLLLPKGSENIKNLKDVEIKEYQGEKLSSISDFRENSIKGVQYVDIKNYALKIEGAADKNLSLSYDEVLNHDKYSKTVTLNCVEGWSVKILWEGVLLKDLLEEAGIKPESNTVIFYAYDGYSSSLPLKYILDNDIILAYKMNGVTIPPERGFPFQVVAEDKWGYKWVKWVTKIELSSDENFKGYWEKSGYNQNGDVNGPIFEK